jgi:hypothetical protein
MYPGRTRSLAGGCRPQPPAPEEAGLPCELRHRRERREAGEVEEDQVPELSRVGIRRTRWYTSSREAWRDEELLDLRNSRHTTRVPVELEVLAVTA